MTTEVRVPTLGESVTEATVATWFKKQDKDKNQTEGKQLLEQELSRLNIPWSEAEQAKDRFNMVTLDDLLASIGGGDVRLNQVVNYIQSKLRNEQPPEIDPRFLALDNVLLQPHQSSGTVDTRKVMGQVQRDNLAAFFAGRPLLPPVA